MSLRSQFRARFVEKGGDRSRLTSAFPANP
nr:MAG TPA: hypothetical protein [Caudoviricetes sp.]DAY01344.1 MAG TPA: hypothetical protein [Caudoviricetes sp.]